MIVIILKQYRPEFAVYISIISGIIIFGMIIDKLAGVISIFQNLSNRAGTSSEFIGILLKITGIAIITEFAVNICRDCNENSIASKIDFGGKILIISTSIPIISALLETLIGILP